MFMIFILSDGGLSPQCLPQCLKEISATRHTWLFAFLVILKFWPGLSPSFPFYHESRVVEVEVTGGVQSRHEPKQITSRSLKLLGSKHDLAGG